MLPDFIELKRKLMKRMDGSVFARLKGDPLLSQIPHVETHEGDEFSIHRADGSFSRKRYELHEAKVKVDRSDIQKRGVEAVAEIMDEMMQKIMKDTHLALFRTLEQDVTQGVKGPISPEKILEALRMQEMSFDDDDKEQIQVICGPDTAPAIQEAYSRLESDPALKKQYDELMDRKRKEWRDREANRKLVD